jgi:hypothetical protein
MISWLGADTSPVSFKLKYNALLSILASLNFKDLG